MAMARDIYITPRARAGLRATKMHKAKVVYGPPRTLWR